MEATQPNQPKPPAVLTDDMQVLYANFCRGTMTPEEVILDFALNPNSHGKVLDEEIEVRQRTILSFPAAKRLLFLLHDILRRHEENFGPIETDFQKRMIKKPASGANPPSPQG
jgi:hypothetical protein